MQASAARRSDSTLKDLEIEELIRLSEKDLQAGIIEPLLRKMGFRNVHDTSGPRERGKDLIGTLQELGRDRLWAIQIKKFKPSSKAGAPESFGRLLDQLRQTMQEPVLDVLTGVRRPPDRCMFITPYAISPNDMEHFHARLKEPIFSNLLIVDGRWLCDQIQERMPEAIQKFSMEIQYRISVARNSTRIKESTVAFELGQELHLDGIYVDASLGEGSELLSRVALIPTLSESERHQQAIESTVLTGSLKDPLVTTTPEVDALTFSPIYEEWVGRELTDINSTALQSRPRNQVVIDISPLVRHVQQKLLRNFADLSSMAETETSVEMCRTAANDAIKLEQDIRRLIRHPFIQKHFAILARPQSSQRDDRKPMSVPSSALLKIPVCMYVMGPPGTGKTTLLRRITQLTAKDTSAPIPVFVPLIRLSEFTRRGIIKACRSAMEEDGFPLTDGERSKNNFDNMLKSGRIRLCLDGLDETGVDASRAMIAINDIAREFPKLQVILSCRDSFTKTRQEEILSYWERALTIRVLPFSDVQLGQFIEKWFSAEPSSRIALMKWLNDNPGMKRSASTPLIAALLCSLFQVKAELPRTELELYSRRLELLLGRWERAKGVQRLAPEVRTRYELFLMDLAFTLHCKEVRRFSYDEALKIISKYRVKNFHPSNLAMLQDCVQRGVLEPDENGQLSFGHLTYQEHLCAEWMSYHNLIDHIASVLPNPWWAKACEFYAAKKLDITPLAKLVVRSGNKAAVARVRELFELAPLTAISVLAEAGRMKT